MGPVEKPPLASHDERGEMPDEEFDAEHEVSMPSPDRRDDLTEDYEKLLRVAEELQARLDVASSRYELMILMLGGTVGATVATSLYIVTVIGRPPVVLIYALPLLLVFVSLSVRLLNRTRRLRARDKRALVAIVELLRETEAGIAYQGALTPMELAQFRIRLARFDIGAD